MDADRFDALLRTLMGMRSRRGVLRTLSGLGITGALTRADMMAKKKHKKKHKKRRAAPLPLSPSPPGPPSGPPPPSADCPPVCPICQGCNAATGQCVGHPSQQSQPAPGCTAPRVCCGGSCCEHIHACNTTGTCQTCAEACPGEFCEICAHYADGSTHCIFTYGLRCDLNETCSTDTDCPSFRPTCMTAYTDRATNVTAQVCGQPVGSGWCVSISGCGA